MAFVPAESRIPTSVGGIYIQMYERPQEIRPDGTTYIPRGISYAVEVLDQNGNRMRVPGDAGDLVPHLTQTQINALLQFMADLRTKAETEFLGG